MYVYISVYMYRLVYVWICHEMKGGRRRKTERKEQGNPGARRHQQATRRGGKGGPGRCMGTSLWKCKNVYEHLSVTVYAYVYLYTCVCPRGLWHNQPFPALRLGLWANQ